MANLDNPNGFRAEFTITGTRIPVLTEQTKVNVTLHIGDALIKDPATGLLDIALATSSAIYGFSVCDVVGEAGVSKDVSFVPATKDIVFSGQCSGTYSVALSGDDVDIEGTTGIMEINEDSSTYGVVHILGLDTTWGNAVGANARVYFLVGVSQFVP